MVNADTMLGGGNGKAGLPVIKVDPKLNQTSYGGAARETSEEIYAAGLKHMITDYHFENNRRYHAYKAGRYVYPNDEMESDRLDIMHKMTEVVLGGKLFLAPINRSPQRILDIGTGTGSWAIDMADKHPKTEILGNDLSPIQPQWAPPNVYFEVDDVEADWTYSNTFDYIHCRYMGNAIRDWNRLVKQCFEFTAPMGHTELLDLDFVWRSPDHTMRPSSICAKMNAEFLKASRAAGFEPCPGALLEGYLNDAGFTDINVQKFAIPIGPWAKDPHMKHIGSWNYLQVMQGLESFMYRLFTTILGYSRAECDVVCTKMRQEMEDPKIHMYFDMYVAYGKKPAASGLPSLSRNP